MARLTICIFEQSEREDITTIMTDEWKKWHGEEVTNRRRIALRIEKELIVMERDVKETELAAREAIAEQEHNKFQMFLGLCARGVVRILEKEGGVKLPTTSGD